MKRRVAKVLVWTTLALCLSSQTQSAFAATTFTFTSAGASGASGPTAPQLTTAYSGTNLAGQVSESTSVGIQLWTVPQTGNYTILAIGASGGAGGSPGGYGAKIQGDFTFIAGTVLQIVVGETGTASGSGIGGGGGASFVTGLGVSDSRSVYVVAGGGGGGAKIVETESSTINATTSDPSNQGSSAANTFIGNTATGGSGGAGNLYSGGGGGGLLTSGTSGDGCGGGGSSFIAGSTGGSGTAPGGFGGGGAGEYCTWGGGGGGGGYSGGGGGTNPAGYGGGGSSLNRGTNQNNLISSSYGGGSITITLNYAIVPGSINLALQGGGNAPKYRTVSNLVGTVNETSTVTFFQNSKPIPGCRNMYAVNSVTCAWKPAVMGNAVITATMTPQVQGSTAGSSIPLFLSVVPRNTFR